jgi:uncharacterized protein YcfJ
MKSLLRPGLGISLTLSLLMMMTAIPICAKSSPRHSNGTTVASEATTANAATAADRNTDTAQYDTSAPPRHHMRSENHNSGKRRGVIIGGTALTGMLIGAHVGGPIGALAGAGVGAGVGMFLAHIL